jgi:hypothetical protein
MKLVTAYRGFEICRTSAGHLVVVDPRDTAADRAALAALLASGGVIDALFFPSLADAATAIDDFVALGLVH